MIFEYIDLTEEEGMILDENNEEVLGMIRTNPSSLLEIEEGMILSNPKMEIVSVYYDLKTNEFRVEVNFWETKLIHSRSFSTINNAPGSLTMEAVIAFVGTHPILSQFNQQV